MDDYDHYLSTKFTSGVTMQSNIPVSQPTLSGMSNMMSHFITNVKLDVKQYPIFNGDNAQ